MTNFSSAGPTSIDGWAKPDLVTSGRSVVSLAAPGSTIYNENPSARIGSGNFVGSGTSFSAAITSGAAALVLADNPGLTPDQLKARLLGTTEPGPGRQSLRRRARGPERVRRGHRGPDEPRPVRRSACCRPCPARRFRCHPAQLGQHLERESLVGCLVAAGFREQARVDRAARGTARPGTALPGPARPGITAAGQAPPGTAPRGRARPGMAPRGPGSALERRRLDQRRLERVGMELAALAPSQAMKRYPLQPGRSWPSPSPEASAR